MSKKIFVGGLSWNISQDDLLDHFKKFGEISDVKLITDYETGRSKGFGFITFMSSDSAVDAIETMNGVSLDNRVIKVSEAIDRDRSRNQNNGNTRFSRRRW